MRSSRFGRFLVRTFVVVAVLGFSSMPTLAAFYWHLDFPLTGQKFRQSAKITALGRAAGPARVYTVVVFHEGVVIKAVNGVSQANIPYEWDRSISPPGGLLWDPCDADWSVELFADGNLYGWADIEFVQAP